MERDVVLMSDVVRASSPVDVIGLVPVLLGFDPERSCSVLVLGTDNRVVVTARVDLADVAVAGGGLAENLAGLQARYGVSSLVVLHGEDLEEPSAAVRVLAGSGLVMQEVFAVVGGSWWWVDPCSGVVEPGGAVPSVPSAAVVEARVLSGVVPEVSRAAVVERVAPPGLERWPGLIAGYEAAERVAAQSTLRERVAVVRAFVEAYGVPGGGVPSPDEVALVVVLVKADVTVRDVAWSLLERGESASAVAALWGEVVRGTHPEWSAPVLGLFGWASWVAGDGASVNVAVEALDRWAPGYSWASLLAGVVDGAVSPALWSSLVGSLRPVLAAEVASRCLAEGA